MLFLVGLGNPGAKYANNRHNIGFHVMDALADRNHFGPPRKRFQGEAREGTLNGAKALALKPMTYMNESGRSVGEAMRFYRAGPGDVFVFYDELDLPPGKLRVKQGGGAAGHNGIRSIAQHIGPDFHRVRLGIGHPGDKNRVQRHVLGDFTKADAQWLGPLIAAIADNAGALSAGTSQFMNKVHLATASG